MGVLAAAGPAVVGLAAFAPAAVIRAVVGPAADVLTAVAPAAVVSYQAFGPPAAVTPSAVLCSLHIADILAGRVSLAKKLRKGFSQQKPARNVVKGTFSRKPTETELVMPLGAGYPQGAAHPTRR